MKKKFEKNDVLRYLYKEMDPVEEEAFILAICNDEELWQAFEELQQTQQNLETAELRPSGKTVNNILSAASKATKRSKTRTSTISGKRGAFLKIQQLVMAAMLLFTTGGVITALYLYKYRTTENLVSKDIPQLQWEDHSLNKRIEMAKYNVESVGNDRETVLHLYDDTYQLVNTDYLSSFSQNIVLLNIK